MNKDPIEHAKISKLAKRIMDLKTIPKSSLEYAPTYEKLLDLPYMELVVMRNDLMKPSSLRLHERYFDKKVDKDILKVPNGYLYSDWDFVNDLPYNTIYVPR